jgi:hypothetical protein
VSASDVAIWATAAGWSGVPPAIDATTAVACALASSQGNPGAHNGLFGLGNVGDGKTQTQYAHDQVAAHGWDALPAHRNGSYLLYMPAASVAVTTAGAAVIAKNPQGFIDGVYSGLADVAGNLPGDTLLDQAKTGIALLTKAGAWLGDPNNWARILLVVLGGGMVIGGVTLAAGSSAAGPIAGTATKLAGKAVKTIA